jgi:hypothetical protein
MYICPIPNGFTDRAVLVNSSTECAVHGTEKQHAMFSYVLQKCIDVDGGIFGNALLGKLYQVCHLNYVCPYYKPYRKRCMCVYIYTFRLRITDSVVKVYTRMSLCLST